MNENKKLKKIIYQKEKINMTNIFSIILIFLLSLINAQEANDMTKAVACMTIINRLVQEEGGEPDPRKFSPMMLNCFVSIKDTQLKEIMDSMRSGSEYSDKNAIKKLTDASGLQSKYKPEELMELSKRLNNAIDKFKKIQENRGGFSMEDLEEPSDKGSKGKGKGKGNNVQRERSNGGGIIGLLLRGIGNILDIANSSFLVYVVFLLGLFFSLRFLKMLCKTNKPKKKVKKSE